MTDPTDPVAGYPPVLFVRHLAELYGLSQRRIQWLAQIGHYDFALLRPANGLEFSRDRIREHLLGHDMRGITPPRRRRP